MGGAVIVASWLACAPEPEPDRDPDPTADSGPPPLPACPPVDWSVHVRSIYDDTVHRVVALPGGDTLVAGTSSSGGIRLGTGPDDVVNHTATAGRTVARLAPDGRARWAHAVGSGLGWAAELGRTADSVWIAGNQGLGSLTVDLDVLPGAVHNPDQDDAFAVQFDLETGSTGRWVYVGGPGVQVASGVAEDPEGNVYATGSYRDGGLDLGDGFALPGPPRINGGDWAWLASWDQVGRVRWLVGAESAKGRGLVWKDGALFWNLLGGDNGWIQPTGVRTPFEKPDSPIAEVLYPVDPATGTVLPAQAELFARNASWSEVGLDSTGNLTATGFVGGQSQWVDEGGVGHDFASGSPDGAAAQVTWTKDGKIQVLDELPGYSGYGGDVALKSFTASQSHSAGIVLNEGTPWAFRLDPTGVAEGMAGWRRPDGVVECVWAFGGIAQDAVRDEAGGFVVVGQFSGPMEVRDRDDQVVHTFDGSVSSGGEDGFILRFAWPSE